MSWTDPFHERRGQKKSKERGGGGSGFMSAITASRGSSSENGNSENGNGNDSALTVRRPDSQGPENLMGVIGQGAKFVATAVLGTPLAAAGTKLALTKSRVPEPRDYIADDANSLLRARRDLEALIARRKNPAPQELKAQFDDHEPELRGALEFSKHYHNVADQETPTDEERKLIREIHDKKLRNPEMDGAEVKALARRGSDDETLALATIELSEAMTRNQMRETIQQIESTLRSDAQVVLHFPPSMLLRASAAQGFSGIWGVVKASLIPGEGGQRGVSIALVKHPTTGKVEITVISGGSKTGVNTLGESPDIDSEETLVFRLLTNTKIGNLLCRLLGIIPKDVDLEVGNLVFKRPAATNLNAEEVRIPAMVGRPKDAGEGADIGLKAITRAIRETQTAARILNRKQQELGDSSEVPLEAALQVIHQRAVRPEVVIHQAEQTYERTIRERKETEEWRIRQEVKRQKRERYLIFLIRTKPGVRQTIDLVLNRHKYVKPGNRRYNVQLGKSIRQAEETLRSLGFKSDELQELFDKA